MNYVTDTHSLVWYFTEDPNLSKKAYSAYENTIKKGTIIIPAIVLAEIMYIARKGRIQISFIDTLEKINRYKNFFIAPLDITTLMTADTIKNEMEMHDKLIIATALYYETALITKDNNIRKSKIVKTIW